jgi:hypothetical protein
MPYNPYVALAAYLQTVLPDVLTTQTPTLAPDTAVSPPSLADLARASGRQQTDVTKVTISGRGGTGPKHGQRYPYAQEQGGKTLVWDAVQGTWVPRRLLSADPGQVRVERK